MKKEQEDKQFLGGLLIGIILGAMIGYFTFRIVTAIGKSPIESSVEHIDKKVLDWSNHPNVDKRLFLKTIYER